MPADDRLVSVAYIAADLCLSVRSVWAYIAAGLLPQPSYLGRQARWPLSTYLQARAQLLQPRRARSTLSFPEHAGA
jgi:predicted DNA-binding transcriptional regulator AlpA